MRSVFKKTLLLILALILPGLAIGLMYWGWQAYRDIYQLKSAGVAGNALIVDKELVVRTDVDPIERNHFLYYQLRPDMPVVEELVEEWVYEKYRRRDSVRIVYLPDQPEIARMIERGVTYRVAVWRIGSGAVLLVVVLWYGYQLYRGRNP